MATPPIALYVREMSDLQTALDHWHSGDRQAALRQLLSTWRAHRHAALADLIHGVSRTLDPEPTSLPGRTVKARREAWIALAREGDPLHFERLAAHFEEKAWRPTREKLDAWTPRDDPRLARFAVGLLERRPWKSRASETLYQDLVRLLLEVEDVRSRPPAPRRKPIFRWERERAAAHEAASAWEDPPLPAAERDALTAWQRWFPPVERGPVDLDALLAAVYADPDDDGARAVYADALAVTDPHRATFITLQLAGTPRAEKQAAKLQKTHGQDWVPPAIAAIAKDVTFERGFPSRVVLVEHRGTEPDLQDPGWNTVRALTHPHAFQYRAALNATSWFARLHEAIGCLSALRDREDVVDWRVTSLTPYADADTLACFTRTPHLHTLVLETTSPTRVLPYLEHPGLPAVHTLVFRGGDWITWSAEEDARLPASVRTLRFVGAHGTWTVTRTPDGPTVDLVGTPHALEDEPLRYSVETVRALSYSATKNVHWTRPDRDRFEAWVARHPRAAPVDRPWGPLTTRPRQPLDVRLLLFGELATAPVLDWLATRPFGWTVDTLTATRRPARLQKRAAAQVDRWRVKRRRVALTEDGDDGRQLRFEPQYGASLTTDGLGTRIDPADAPTLLQPALEGAGATHLRTATARYRPDRPRWRQAVQLGPLGWLAAFGPAWERLLPRDGLQALARDDLEVTVHGDWTWLRHRTDPVVPPPDDDDSDAAWDVREALFAVYDRTEAAVEALYADTLASRALDLASTLHDTFGHGDEPTVVHDQPGVVSLDGDAHRVWAFLAPGFAHDTLVVDVLKDGRRGGHEGRVDDAAGVRRVLREARATLT
jgi:uncharacterized protein (TIGR02996 family)